MNLAAFLSYSALGTVLWSGLLAYAGYHLEAHYASVAHYVNYATMAVIGLVILAYLYRVVTYSSERAG